MTYYAQRKSIKNETPETINNRYGTRRAMERQYHLFCANANDGENFPFDIDSIEWGTVENGVIERKLYVKEEPEETEQGE